MMKTTILLIEDNAQNSYLTTFILESNGFEVLSVEDGAKGIALAKETKPKLILLDIQLPVMNGYEVATQLRKIPSLNDVPIIAVTSYAMTGDREKCLAAGCNGYIEKPINPETFISEISEYLKAN